ncbi:HYR-like domain-containing protein, partial [Flavobacterium taihuense]
VTAPLADVAALSDVTGECSATVTAPTATDNCAGVITATTLDPVSYSAQGTYTIHWTYNDGNGNTSAQTQTVIVKDVTAPLADVATLADVTGECSATATAPTATDNCAGVITATTLDPVSYFAQGTYTIHWNYSDGNGNTSAQTQTVIVKDVTAPTIICPADIALSTCMSTATWSVPNTYDNCSAVTVLQTAGPAPGSSNFGIGTTVITYTATDTGGNTTTCSFNVIRATALSASITTDKSMLYFGYTGDQTANITATPSGGTAPYIVKITMVNGATPIVAPAAVRTNGQLICGFINASGKEVWTPGLSTNVGLSTGISCSTNSVTASSTSYSINGSYSVNVALLADARFLATVIDANGCTYTTPYDLAARVDAEDVRCFAGNSGVVKVAICHQTGSAKNPCTAICVDQSAVQEHLNHGDFLGKCTSTCKAPASNAKTPHSDKILVEATATDIEPVEFVVKVFPNPTDNQFTLVLEGGSSEKIEVLVYDMLARKVKSIEKNKNQAIIFGEEFPVGEYIVLIRQGDNAKTLNLIKK